jgi:hypothetical protein
MNQAARNMVMRAPRVDTEYFPADFGRAEHLAFEREVSELISRIQDPERAVKLKAIGDNWLAAQINVLGSEIAMSFDNPSAPHAIVEQTGLVLEKVKLCRRHISNEIGG